MKLAFVVPRYGPEVSGGGELLCRQVAERLVRHCAVEVITTCALDYRTWENHYPEGSSVVNGVTVHRFRVDRPRDPDEFRQFTECLFLNPHSPLDELEWMLKQGPYSLGLLDFLRSRRHDYDLFVFFIYLYFTTFFGLPLVPDKSVLVPLAHDEPPFHLDLFRPVFYLPRQIIYSTLAERELVHWKHGRQLGPGVVIGGGVELPPGASPDGFRRRYGLADDFILYVGRVNESKWCHELFEYFSTYKAQRPGRLKLVLLGKREMPIPRRPDIRALAFVPEEDKVAGLRAAQLFVMPSRFESFSLATLEAWLAAKPVLVSGHCEVLKEHCRKSRAGLYYSSGQEFAACLDLLLEDDGLRQRLGENGCRYVREHYPWEAVERQYREVLFRTAEQVRGHCGQ